jgi:hypothetical protein
MFRGITLTVLSLTVLITGPAHATSLRSGDILALTADGVIIRIEPVSGASSVVASGGLLANPGGIAATQWATSSLPKGTPLFG